MSYCSHQLLDWDASVQLYRCRDCPNLFEARIIGTGFKREEKTSVRILPIIGIMAGLVFGLAVLFVGYKLVISPSDPFPGGGVCLETEKWEKRTEEANRALNECRSRPPKIKIVEVAADCPIQEREECSQASKEEPQQCPQAYKEEFQQCMTERGDAIYQLNRLRQNQGNNSRCELKVKELRAILSDLIKNRGGECPRATVNVPECDCANDIKESCGEIREALNFYFSKSKSQPGDESDDGLPDYFGPSALIEDEDYFLELDED